MMKWITSNPLYAGIILAALLAVVAGGYVVIEKKQKRQENTLVNQGELIERTQSQSETINAVQNAQQVVDHPSTEQLNIVCGKYDRNCPHRP
jgi:cell division protein FtsN